jgi:hypothetical protein
VLEAGSQGNNISRSIYDTNAMPSRSRPDSVSAQPPEKGSHPHALPQGKRTNVRGPAPPPKMHEFAVAIAAARGSQLSRSEGIKHQGQGSQPFCRNSPPPTIERMTARRRGGESRSCATLSSLRGSTITEFDAVLQVASCHPRNLLLTILRNKLSCSPPIQLLILTSRLTFLTTNH